jgi:hypothetical protein
MTIKVPKEKIYVKIKTRTANILGYIYVMTGGRVIDYVNSQNNKFIPITEAEVFPIESEPESESRISGKNDLIILNVKDIEMLTTTETNHKEELDI